MGPANVSPVRDASPAYIEECLWEAERGASLTSLIALGALAVTGADAFAHSRKVIEAGHLHVHPSLDPYVLRIRESRDSSEHPESNAVLISLDVTGSMARVVRGVHRDLPRLHELLLGHAYLPHPQILFAAIGDATCDKVPLQVGQFESDNRMDLNLENMVLEGGGGGQKTESYELALYVAADALQSTAGKSVSERGTYSSSATRWPTTSCIRLILPN